MRSDGGYVGTYRGIGIADTSSVPLLAKLFDVASLCNNAHMKGYNDEHDADDANRDSFGSPTEIALLVATHRFGLEDRVCSRLDSRLCPKVLAFIQ